MKKSIAVILSIWMLLSLLLGCTPEDPTGTQPTDSTEATASTISTDSTQSTNPVPTEPTPTEPAELVTVHCIREAVVWQKNNDQTHHSIFTYDEYGNLLERKSDTDGYYKAKETYQYDAQGNLICGPLNVGGSYPLVTYTYDELGRLISESYKDYKQIKYIYSFCYCFKGQETFY